jgi:hypothetical protein
MPHQFRRHYTRDEARTLLPQVREWLSQLREQRAQLDRLDTRITQIMAHGADAGSGSVNEWVRCFAASKRVLREFTSREIQIKDLDRGLLDFPTLMAGREVFLCWEEDEDDIEFWHDLDSGFAGRERLNE